MCISSSTFSVLSLLVKLTKRIKGPIRLFLPVCTGSRHKLKCITDCKISFIFCNAFFSFLGNYTECSPLRMLFEKIINDIHLYFIIFKQEKAFQNDRKKTDR